VPLGYRVILAGFYLRHGFPRKRSAEDLEQAVVSFDGIESRADFPLAGMLHLAVGNPIFLVHHHGLSGWSSMG